MIRSASGDDAGNVITLWRACELLRPWNDPERDFALAVRGPSSTIFVAERGSDVIGSVMVGFDGHRGWVYYLAVALAMRRGGIGRALMAAAEAWLRERDVPKLQLMVRNGNDAALRFYAALGMERQDVVTLGRFLNDAG